MSNLNDWAAETIDTQKAEIEKLKKEKDKLLLLLSLVLTAFGRY